MEDTERICRTCKFWHKDEGVEMDGYTYFYWDVGGLCAGERLADGANWPQGGPRKTLRRFTHSDFSCAGWREDGAA